MAKDYDIEIVKDEPWKLPKVRVNYKVDEHWINTFADMAEGIELSDMGKWCEENDCGHRTSYNEFKFRNESQMTHFILKWS